MRPCPDQQFGTVMREACNVVRSKILMQVARQEERRAAARRGARRGAARRGSEDEEGDN
jgi:hypothetical protein